MDLYRMIYGNKKFFKIIWILAYIIFMSNLTNDFSREKNNSRINRILTLLWRKNRDNIKNLKIQTVS